MRKLLATAAMIMAVTTGAAFAETTAPAHEGFDRKARFEETLSKLPKDKAELVRSSFKAQHETSRAEHEKLKAIRDKQKAIMTADKFDKNAFLANAQEAQAIRDTMQQKRTQAFAEVLSQLNPAERKILADSMHRRGMRHRHEGEKPRS